MLTSLHNPKTAGALLSAPMLAALCLLAAAVAVATPGWVLSGDAAHTLGCTLSRVSDGGTQLLLVNRGPHDLPAGTAFVWHDSGSPRGVAERLTLPSPLERGDSVLIRSEKQAHGAGCGARWLTPEQASR